MTWDQALARRLRAADHQRRARFLAAVLVIGLGVGLLPGLARADYGPPGLNYAQIDLSDDGYNSATSSYSFGSGRADLTGRSFTPNDVARIFECPDNRVDLPTDCLAIGAIVTDSEGRFGPTPIVMLGFFSTVHRPASPTNGSGVSCRGIATADQCVVVAATYGVTGQQPLAQADHFICFDSQSGCKPKPTGDWQVTTTTTNPPPPPEWEPAASMNVARQGLATAVGADGRIYALGGNEPAGAAINSAEVFDPCGARRWSSIPPMPRARTEFAAATGSDGRIYAIGGRDSRYGTPLATVDAYDPETNAWSSVSGLAVPRGDLAAATGSDGRIYAIGGLVGGGGSFNGTILWGVQTSIVEAYDLATAQWQPAAPLLAARWGHAATVGPDGRIYAVGGSGSLLTPTIPAVESYTPGPAGAPGVWTPSSDPTSLQTLPPQMAVATGPDGLIYGTGGVISANTEAIRIWRTYNTGTGTWTTSPEAMISRRTTHAAATGRDGRIYAIGGTDNPQFFPPRSGATATLVCRGPPGRSQ